MHLVVSRSEKNNFPQFKKWKSQSYNLGCETEKIAPHLKWNQEAGKRSSHALPLDVNIHSNKKKHQLQTHTLKKIPCIPNKKCLYFTIPAGGKIFSLLSNKPSQWNHHNSVNKKPLWTLPFLQWTFILSIPFPTSYFSL